MKIRSTLYQFPHPSIILVLDGSTVRFFNAHQGVLSELPQYTVSPPEKKERKPIFRTSGHGHVWSSGSPEVRPPKEQYLSLLTDKMNDVVLPILRTEKVQKIFLVCPRPILRHVTRKLHPYIQKLITRTLAHDFVHEHPRAIVERLTEEMTQ
ncbi:MAG: host attachment protein [bacterium]